MREKKNIKLIARCSRLLLFQLNNKFLFLLYWFWLLFDWKKIGDFSSVCFTLLIVVSLTCTKSKPQRSCILLLFYNGVLTQLFIHSFIHLLPNNNLTSISCVSEVVLRSEDIAENKTGTHSYFHRAYNFVAVQSISLEPWQLCSA